MRLIDADKLKEYVNSKSTHPLCEWDTAGVLMAIDEQGTVEFGWIPVSERLPTEKEYYRNNGWFLCTYKIKNTIFVGELHLSNFSENEWESDYQHSGYDVMAWMPLPEQYKA